MGDAVAIIACESKSLSDQYANVNCVYRSGEAGKWIVGQFPLKQAIRPDRPGREQQLMHID